MLQSFCGDLISLMYDAAFGAFFFGAFWGGTPCFFLYGVYVFFLCWLGCCLEVRGISHCVSSRDFRGDWDTLFVLPGSEDPCKILTGW